MIAMMRAAILSLTLAGILLPVVASCSTSGSEDGEEDAVQTRATGNASADELEALRDEDQAKPRFSGDVLGIWVKDVNGSIPDEYVGYVGCDDRQEMPYEAAGPFSLGLRLDHPYILDELAIETGVVACGGEVVSSSWRYTYVQEYPGRLIIARSANRYLAGDVATDRVETRTVRGREAVVLKPIRPNAAPGDTQWGTNVYIAFPEEFGSTTIDSLGIPFDEVLRVAEMVGESTR